MEMLEELEVSFLLPGNEVVDEHRALSSNGFVNGCSTGFTDDKMMCVEELRNFSRPT
jgi:hypothetical protein